MSAVTYGESYGHTAEVVAPRKGWLARFIDHVVEARTKQAAREVELHLGYLPEAMRRGHREMVESQQELPFGR